MARNILILGASYGSLLGTKLLMAGQNVSLVCRKNTADLINREGTEVRIKLRDEKEHRSIFSRDLPGKLDAVTPADVDVSRYDMVGLAMQEPQYTNHTVRVLMIKIAAAKLPCLSIMNMPPLPYLKRIPALAGMDLEEAYTNAQVWERFEPGLVRSNRLWRDGHAKSAQCRFDHQKMVVQKSGSARPRRFGMPIKPQLPGQRPRA